VKQRDMGTYTDKELGRQGEAHTSEQMAQAGGEASQGGAWYPRGIACCVKRSCRSLPALQAAGLGPSGKALKQHSSLPQGCVACNTRRRVRPEVVTLSHSECGCLLHGHTQDGVLHCLPYFQVSLLSGVLHQCQPDWEAVAAHVHATLHRRHALNTVSAWPMPVDMPDVPVPALLACIWCTQLHQHATTDVCVGCLLTLLLSLWYLRISWMYPIALAHIVAPNRTPLQILGWRSVEQATIQRISPCAPVSGHANFTPSHLNTPADPGCVQVWDD
jgi:hypothetical protein